MVYGNTNRLLANESKSTNAGKENDLTILYQNVVYFGVVSQYEGLKLVCHARLSNFIRLSVLHQKLSHSTLNLKSK